MHFSFCIVPQEASYQIRNAACIVGVCFLALGWSLSSKGRWIGVPITIISAPILLFTSPSLALWSPFLLVSVLFLQLFSNTSTQPLKSKVLATTMSIFITLLAFLLAKDFYSASPINESTLIDVN